MLLIFHISYFFNFTFFINIFFKWYFKLIYFSFFWYYLLIFPLLSNWCWYFIFLNIFSLIFFNIIFIFLTFFHWFFTDIFHFLIDMFLLIFFYFLIDIFQNDIFLINFFKNFTWRKIFDSNCVAWSLRLVMLICFFLYPFSRPYMKLLWNFTISFISSFLIYEFQMLVAPWFIALFTFLFWRFGKQAIRFVKNWIRIRELVNQFPGPPTIPVFGNAYNLKWDAVGRFLLRFYPAQIRWKRCGARPNWHKC